MTGDVGILGNPYMGRMEVRTTAISGTFEIWADIPYHTPPIWVLKGGGAVVLPTQTTPGNIGPMGFVNLMSHGQYFDATFVAGVFINPSTPGLYFWGPNTATASTFPFPVAPMDPRPGESMEIEIVSCAVVAVVGGSVMPVNASALVLPWLVVIGIVGCVGTVILVAKKRR